MDISVPHWVSSRARGADDAIQCPRAVSAKPPFTWAGAALGFTPLPWLYWPLVLSMLVTYSVLTHLTKVWFVRRWGM
jgi:hypothetical protein